MQRFSDYVNKRQFNLVEFMLDEGEGQQFGGQRFPIPLNLAMLLSLVPGGPNMQGQALKYIMTDALYRAAKGRQQIAKQMSEDLGREVKEYEVFSPDIHEKDPNVKFLWDQYQKEYEDKYEPKYIRLDYGGNIGDVMISIPKLNGVLQQHGLPPVQFGGPHGLVELMESGRGWAKGKPSLLPAHGEGAHHERNGIDLSHPRLHRYADKPNEPRVAFGFSPNMDADKRGFREPGWEPSINTTYYTRRMHQWLSRMSAKAEQLMSGIPDDDPQKEQLAQIFGSIAKGMTKSNTSLPDKTFGQGGGEVGFDDMQGYEAIKKKVRAAFDAFNAMPQEDRQLAGVPLRQASEDEIKSMMNKIFPMVDDGTGNLVPATDQDGNMIVRQQVSGFGPFNDAGKGGSKILVSSLLNWLHHKKIKTPKGGDDAANPERGDFNPYTLRQDLPGMDDVFEKPKTTQKVLGPNLSHDILKHDYDGYFPMDDTEGDVESKIAMKKPFYLTNGEDEIAFRFDKESGNWIASQMAGGGDPHSEFQKWRHQSIGADPKKKVGGCKPLEPSPVILPGNDQMGFIRPHNFDHIPVYGKSRQKLLAMWDKFAAATGGDRAEEADIVKRSAASQVKGRGGETDFDTYKDEAGDAFEAFEKLLGSPKFFFGELGRHFAALLAKNNFDPHEAMAISKKVEEMLNKGELPSPEALSDEFGPEGKNIYNLLLQNGKGWRIGAATALLAGNIAHVKKVRGKERTGVGSTNKEGEQSDVMANAGEDAAAKRHAMGQDTTAAISGKLNRTFSGRSTLSGGQADLSKAAGHVGQSAVYKSEGEREVGPTNKPTFDEFYGKFFTAYKGMFRPNDVESLWQINGHINKLQNSHPNGEVIRAAGNAAVMDVLHDVIKDYAASIKQDDSKRALAQILFNLFANPDGGLKEILTSDEEEESSVDTGPLIRQIQPLLGHDKQMKVYFDALKDGKSLESIPPVEEKPQKGLSVVGTPTAAAPKPTFGGTSGGGMTTTSQQPVTFQFNGRTWTPETFKAQVLDFLEPEDIHTELPPQSWSQFPEPVRRMIQAKAGQQNLAKAESLLTIDQFLTMLRETDAIFDGSKPTTFNWWGAVGDPLGKVIDGDVPVKKKKKHARK
jgi:hypothetical protein